MKRSVPLIITAIAGLVLVASYFLPMAQGLGEDVAVWFDILAGIAFILGGGNLVKMQLRKISDRAAGWGYAAVTLLTFVVVLTVGLLKFGVTPPVEHPAHTWAGSYNENGSAFWWFFEYVLQPLMATMFAMLAFYVASAAYRAFRAKNVEATLLLLTAVIVLLGRTYAGVWVTQWLPEDSLFRVENLANWINETFTTTGNRAITIGIALGVVSTSLKIILGIDRSYLGSGKD